MNIESARWSDETQSEVVAIIDGQRWQVPADPQNRHYREIIERGIEIAPAE